MKLNFNFRLHVSWNCLTRFLQTGYYQSSIDCCKSRSSLVFAIQWNRLQHAESPFCDLIKSTVLLVWGLASLKSQVESLRSGPGQVCKLTVFILSCGNKIFKSLISRKESFWMFLFSTIKKFFLTSPSDIYQSKLLQTAESISGLRGRFQSDGSL